MDICETFLKAIENKLKELKGSCEGIDEILVLLDFLKHCLRIQEDEEKELLKRMAEQLTKALKRTWYPN